MDDVVTGEAVTLDLAPARVPSRILALAVDLAVLGAVAMALLLGVAVAGDRFDSAATVALSVLLMVLLLVGWPTAWETLTRGRSPGKFAMGLRVVRDDGGPIAFRQALTRALAGVIVDFSLSGVVALVVALVSPRGQRVGDLLAGTVVVHERAPTRGAGTAPPAVPPALARWAAQLQLAALPDDLALAARRFLARSADLAPEARCRLGEQLATDVADRVAPAPPTGTPAETYLAAVLGERYRRESGQRAGPATVAGPPVAPGTAPPIAPGTAGPVGPSGTPTAPPVASGGHPPTPPSGSPPAGSAPSGPDRGFTPPG